MKNFLLDLSVTLNHFQAHGLHYTDKILAGSMSLVSGKTISESDFAKEMQKHGIKKKSKSVGSDTPYYYYDKKQLEQLVEHLPKEYEE